MQRDEQARPTGRVAVIAVHGVADQLPGATAKTLAELLIAATPGDVAYRIEGADDIAIQVAPLAPTPQSQAKAAASAPAAPPATPAGPRPIRKAVAQSMRSDWHRRDWSVDKDEPLKPEPAAPASPNPGVELTDFLLFKAVRNDMPTVAYDTTRLRLSRTDAITGEDRPVDLYEMYWADLSRLSSGVPRVISELFTLLFRLSQLGRDTVGAAARQFSGVATHANRWRWFSSTQEWLDWAFSKGLALLTLQLLMVALIIVPVGLTVPHPRFAVAARAVLSFALPALAALWFLYRFEKSWRSWVLSIAGVAALAVALRWPPAHWVVGITWLVLLSLAYDFIMKICDERFPMTRFVGWTLWPIVLLVVVWSAATLPSLGIAAMDGERGLRVFTFGALRALEWVLVGNILWWGVAGVLLFAWMIVGQACSGTNGFEGRASVATGRLGLFASMSLFVVLVMATWAALTPLLDLSVASITYAPLVFVVDPGALTIAAADFLDARYANSTETFSLLAMMLVILGSYLIIGFFPSVLAEMQILKTGSSRLGRWLTMTYRNLDLSVAVLVIAGVLAATVVGVALNSRWFGAPVLDAVNARFDFVPKLSQDLLKPLIWAAASATVAITALGGVLSRYVPWLRAPLDIALDVDGHFREFPRRGIPRARIFSRFASLLRHVADQGYERVVIVAHSQGTVISTELLRYLKFRALQPRGQGQEAARLWRDLAPALHLLTAGSPLRQLYAARFPTLYRWVLDDDGNGRVGPTADGVGVRRWVNAYATGDYVGRWLWTRPVAPPDRSQAMIDELASAQDVYVAARKAPQLMTAMGSLAQMDVCLGPGAHTHYFDGGQSIVASLVDQLIVSPFDGAPTDDMPAVDSELNAEVSAGAAIL